MRRKYDSLFWRQPNIYGVSLGRIRDENGKITNTWSITLRVTEKVDQATLPHEDRIPDSLEGIPVQILEEQPPPLAMGAANASHRPILPALQVEAGTRDPVTRVLSRASGGTITGPAWREDGSGNVSKVVLMCQHSVTGSIIRIPVGGEVICYPKVSETNVIGTVPPRTNVEPSWNPTSPSGANLIDATYFIPSVGADFESHKDPSHPIRHVLSGAVDPVDNDADPMELLVVGASGGEGTVTVTDIDYTCCSPDDNVTLTDTILLDITQRPIVNGDSGAPCLAHVTGNRYRMCGIIFGGDASIEHAFKATTAQELLKITFGYQVPIANIVAPEEVYPGELVELNGSGSSVRSPGGQPLTCQWDQVLPESAVGTPIVTLANRTQQTASFTALSGNHSLEFQLTVIDNYEAKAVDKVTVMVVSNPPTGVPGWNQAVPVDTMVTLTGGVEDPDTGHADDMDYEWSLVEAPASSTRSSARSAPADTTRRSVVSLVTPTLNGKPVAANRTFTPTRIGDYVFKLTVTDPGYLSAEAKMIVHCCSATGTSQWYDTGETRGSGSTLERKQTRYHNGEPEFRWQPNSSPIAVAGRDQIALVNSEVALMGSVSDLDPADRASVTHTWTQDSGPATVILTTPTDEPGPPHLHPDGGWHVRLSPSPPPTK